MVFYYVFQILPHLFYKGIYPAWEIRAKHYGDPPNHIVIPGALDLAYISPAGPYRHIRLSEFRRRHGQVLGNDWHQLNRIWNAYFRIPKRVLDRADAAVPRANLLGIHYRGTDKQRTAWDTNPITQDQYLDLIEEFLSANSRFDGIFAASDEYSFIQKLAARISLPVHSTGEVEFHLAQPSTSGVDKYDSAVLDCLLLSRCQCVIETSSALPSFAKILNPGLEVYRCAASKLFSDMPYFPVAYIPRLPVVELGSREILETTMADDWTARTNLEKYHRRFVSYPRWPRNHRLFAFSDALGCSELLARVVRGYH